jgi:serine/threonine protein kinase
MNLLSYKRKISTHALPPLTSKQRVYSMRKPLQDRFHSARGSNPEIRSVKSHSPHKVSARSKQTTPYSNFVLSDFQQGKCLGRGKGGRVILCTTQFSEYAVKVVSKELEKYAVIESDILQSVSSPFIVKFYGKIEDAENVYIVLEYIQGLDLFHYMRKKRIRQPEIGNIASQVLMGLEALHRQGIVYRDLKPENVMIDVNGKAKLIDFGLSKAIYGERTKTVCGSPEYMAPEVIRKNTYDYAVDFWALGILLFELFCGYFLCRHPPFEGESFPEICNRILGGSVEFTRSVDPVAKDLIRRLLHTEPAFRLGSQGNKIIDIKQHKFFREINWEQLENPSNI